MSKRGPIDGITRERKWPFFIIPVLWVAAVYVAANVLVLLAIELLKAVKVPLNGDPNVSLTVAYAATFVLVVAITLGGPRLFKLWSSRISYRKLLGLTRILQWRDILFAILGFAVYLALLVGVMMVVKAIVPGFNESQAQDLGFKALSPSNAVLVLVALVVAAPIAEEIVFRGYLFGTLRRTVPVWVAAIITSLVFGLAHGQWNVGVDVFVLSLVSCFLRYKTGVLWPSILLHMIKNGIAFYLLYIASNSIM